ncbi:MAG: folylpolyglutamate synthase/dihydrofolate synthase family protein [Candidatus Rickettsia vulgarisii]
MRMPHFPMPSWRRDGKYNLQNINKLLEVLDNPHLKLPPVIHIAGTNGKGSSVAMLKSIFAASGYKAHAYTSPHLLEFNERIVLRGEKISDSYLFDVCERVRIACLENNIQPNFFEGTTAVAFLAFAETEGDVLILETGLGGRLDATNVVPEPLITLITPISYDHMEYLGDSLSRIVQEKAGIIKPNIPCIISCQVDEVYQVLLDKCQELNSPSFCYEYDFGIKRNIDSFNYLSQNANYQFSLPSLQGDHQLINAAAVIATIGLINTISHSELDPESIEMLKQVQHDKYIAPNSNNKFKITNQNIEAGLQNIEWPARIEKIDPKKYSHLANEHVQIWLDGAHNSGGSQVLSAWIVDNLKAPIYLILGMTKNRDVEDFCSYLKPLTAKGYGVRVLSEVMSYNSETLSARASAAGIEFVPADSLEEAIKAINDLKQPETNIIITGSLFLAADFLKLIS